MTAAAARRFATDLFGAKGAWAEVFDATGLALGAGGKADPSPMEDQGVARRIPGFAGEQGGKVSLDLRWVVVSGPAQPLRDSLDVGVHDDAFRCSERDAEDDVGRFSADSWQLDEPGQGFRNVACVFRHDLFREADQMTSLLPKHTDGRDIGLDLARLGFGEARCVWIAREEPRGHLVDGHVRCLGAKDGRTEELEGIPMLQLAVRIGVELA